MLDYPLERLSSLKSVMDILLNLMDEDNIETDVFVWNPLGVDELLPNFWLKDINLQIEWHRDDPGRGGFTNYDDQSTKLALYVLDTVRESYATYSGGKETPS